ncbi:hypothetical protein ACHAWF_006705 [Thalassiosira exigua]
MVKTYTPEERAERRRRSSQKRTTKPLIKAGDEECDASWIVELRAQGVDVDDFLQAAVPEIVSIPCEQSDKECDRSLPSVQESAKDLPREAQRSAVHLDSEISDVSERVKQRFSQFMDKSYIFDEAVGDVVMRSLEQTSQARWDRERKEDSKNYDPSGTTEEKIRQNREWALSRALRRTGERQCNESHESTASPEKAIHPKVHPPPTPPLPKIDEKDLDLSEPMLNPRDLGIFPPPLPYKLIDLVPKGTRSVGGIADGIVTNNNHEGELSFDSESMVVFCTNAQCASQLICSRGASLVRCKNCDTVSPACPESSSIEANEAAHFDVK